MNVDYGIYTTQGKKKLLGNRATVNGRDAIAYVKDGQLQSYAYMDDFAEQFRCEEVQLKALQMIGHGILLWI